MKTKEVWVIYYDDGERWDGYSAILAENGVFETKELADEEVKKLQIQHDYRIKEDIKQGYPYPSREFETWKSIPITYHYN